MDPSSERLLQRGLGIAERVTKTDMRYLVKGGFWLTLGQIALGLIALGLSVAFSHLVPKDAYGTYRFLLSVFWVLTAFSLTGLPTALSRAIARGFDGTYRKAFTLSLMGSTPLLVIALAMSGYYALNDNLLLAGGMLTIAVLGPLMQVSLLYGSFLEGKKDFKRMALYGIVLNAVTGALILGLMTVTSDPVMFLLAYLGGNIVIGLLLCLHTYRIYKPQGDTSPELFSLSAHFSAMNVISTISQQADKILVFHFLGAVPLAVYTFATALPEQAKSTVNSVATLAFPKFSNRPMHEVLGNFWKRMGLFTLMLALVALVYIVLAPFIFRILFPAYPEAVLYSQVFAISLLLISNAIPYTLLEAQAAKRELYIFNILSPIFQMIVLVVGIIGYGLMGAIVARILGRLFNLILLSGLVHFYKHPVNS